MRVSLGNSSLKPQIVKLVMILARIGTRASPSYLLVGYCQGLEGGTAFGVGRIDSVIVVESKESVDKGQVGGADPSAALFCVLLFVKLVRSMA